MKAIFFILFPFSAYASDTTALPKVDSTRLFMEEVGNNLNIKQLQDFLYKNLTAEKYDEFVQWSNVFLQEEFKRWKEKKK